MDDVSGSISANALLLAFPAFSGAISVLLVREGQCVSSLSYMREQYCLGLERLSADITSLFCKCLISTPTCEQSFKSPAD
jgi:hypothetical protein